MGVITNVKLSAICLIGLTLLWLPRSARAEEYVFEAGRNNNFIDAQNIEKPENLLYLYGVLTRGNDTVDYYAITLDTFTAQMRIELFVPVRDEYVLFRPHLVIVDPGSDRMMGQVPFGFPVDVGGRVYEWQSSTPNKIEDKTAFSDMWVGPKFNKDLAPNYYLIAVFDPQGQGGRYILKIGSQKVPDTFRDIFKKILAFIRIKMLIY